MVPVAHTVLSVFIFFVNVLGYLFFHVLLENDIKIIFWNEE